MHYSCIGALFKEQDVALRCLNSLSMVLHLRTIFLLATILNIELTPIRSKAMTLESQAKTCFECLSHAVGYAQTCLNKNGVKTTLW